MTISHHGREVAKFFAGWAASETVGHWLLGMLGTNLFPITIGRFTFTSTWNTFAMFAWPVVMAGLLYLAWFREEQAEPSSDASTHSAPPCTDGGSI